MGEGVASHIERLPGMRRAVTIELDEFVVDALAGEGRSTAQAPIMVVQAIRCYLKDRDLSRAGWLYPSFLRDRSAARGVELELAVEDDLWRLLEDEAEAQGLSVRQMTEHAALYYMAEVDAGGITRRILDDLGDDDSR